MADYTVKEIDDLEAVNGVFRRARDELGISSFGINCLDLPPDWDGYPAHAEPEQEEVYLPLSGSGEVEIEGERVAIDPSTMLRVGVGTMRKIWPGPDGMRVLALGGIPGRAYEPPDQAKLMEAEDAGVDYAAKRIDEMEAAVGGGVRKARAARGAPPHRHHRHPNTPHPHAHPEHDHAEDGQEEVYVVLDGEAEILIDGEPIDLAPGTMVRVAPGTKRKIRTADSPARVLAVGAVPGTAYEPIGFTELE